MGDGVFSMRNSVTLVLCICTAISVLFFRSQIYELTPSSNTNLKTQDERNDRADLITIHYHERRPYYMSYQGDIQGLVANPVNLIFEKTDIDFQWVKTPAKRQLDIIRANNSATCAAGWFKNSERETFAKFTLPLYQDKPFVGVARADNSLLKDLEILDDVFRESRLRLLLKSGYSYGDFIDKKIQEFNPWQVKTTGDNPALLQMLIDHRADYFFMTEEEAYDLLLLGGLSQGVFKIVRFKDMPKGNLRYLICSNKIPDHVMKSINAAIRSFINISSDA